VETLRPDWLCARRVALGVSGEREGDPETSFTFHSLGSLEPPPLTQLSRGSHVLSFFLCSFMTWSVM
jgi:hypothetical protein